MSEERNLSSPPSSHNTTTSLPPLPDDFLSFQPQKSNDVGDGAAYTTSSLDYVGQEQQRGRGGNYYNNEGRYNHYGQKKGYGGYQKHYSRNDGGNYKFYRSGSYGSPSYNGRGQQQKRGRWNNYGSSKKRRTDVNISSYYKKSFVKDPWADLM